MNSSKCESALVVVLPPGNYTAIVSGANGATGIALLEAVDLRTLGDVYEWIVLKVNIFNFNFKANLAGDNGPQLVIPLKEAS